MSQQVGFSFQGDVFTGGSLVLSTTGRLLKALSDGNIDILAVTAVMHLGKNIPITQVQEAIVSQAIQKRSITRSGFLAKALSVGWGYCDVAYEMSRIRAGCATLLLIDALAAGVSTFSAAQALQILLSLNGCAPEVLPSVDSIHSVVKYLTPIMQDCGFHAILENIRLSIQKGLVRNCFPSSDYDDAKSKVMRDTMDPQEWLSAVQQLCSCSKLQESLYIQSNIRVAWLAAFAVHTLGMACKIVYSSATLWEAPGTRGAVTIQFGLPSSSETSLTCDFLSLQASKEDVPDLETTYFLHEATAAELAELPYIPPTAYSHFYRTLIGCIGYSIHHIRVMRPNKLFMFRGVDEEVAILRVCKYLGLPSDMGLQSETRLALNEFLGQIQDTREVPRPDPDALRRAPDAASGRDWIYDIERLLIRFTTLACSLLPCRLEVNDLRISRLATTRTSAETEIGRILCHYGIVRQRRAVPETPEAVPETPEDPIEISLRSLWEVLKTILCGSRGSPKVHTPDGREEIALSTGSRTIALRLMFEDDAFDSQGEVFGIYPGRLSYGTLLRDAVIYSGARFSTYSSRSYGRMIGGPSWTLVPRTLFRPPDARGQERPDIQCCIVPEETVFEFSLRLVDPSRSGGPFNLTVDPWVLVRCLATTFIGGSCVHDPEQPFVVPDSIQFPRISASIMCHALDKNEGAWISAHGSRFWQMIAIFLTTMIAYPLPCLPVLQEKLCLSCAWTIGCAQVTKANASRGRATSLAIICNRDSSKEVG